MTDSDSSKISRRRILKASALAAAGTIRPPKLWADDIFPMTADEWKNFIGTSHNQSNYTNILEMLARNEKLQNELEELINNLPESYRGYIEVDSRPEVHTLLIIYLAHQHLLKGEPLETLDKKVKDFLIDFAKARGTFVDKESLVFGHTPREQFNSSHSSFCSHFSSFLLFMGDGTVVGLGTNPGLRKHGSKPGFKSYEAGILRGKDSHMEPSFLYETAQKRFFQCGVGIETETRR